MNRRRPKLSSGSIGREATLIGQLDLAQSECHASQHTRIARRTLRGARVMRAEPMDACHFPCELWSLGPINLALNDRRRAILIL
jgi:hypothetical protein